MAKRHECCLVRAHTVTAGVLGKETVAGAPVVAGMCSEFLRKPSLAPRDTPVSEFPLCTCRLMMGANHGAVEDLQRIWDGPALVERLLDVFPPARKRSTPELPVDARPPSKLFG